MLQIKNTLGGGKPEGLYVWKKYKHNPPVTVSNPSITITCPSTSGNKLNITSADIDIKTLWEDLRDTGAGKDLSKILTDANGNISEWKLSSGISIGLASSMTSKIGFVSKSGTQGISYLQEDTSLSTYCAFNMGSSTNYSSYAGTYTFDGDYKISDSSVEFIDYVVSDKETAYPDGGEKGGYWYEKVSGGITPEMFGATKKEEQTFTVSSDVNEKTITHSLGESPKLVLCFPSEATCSESVGPFGTLMLAMMRMYQGSNFTSYPAYGVYAGIYSPSNPLSAKGKFSGSLNGDMFPSVSTVKLFTSGNFISGNTYKVILLA